MYLCFVFKVRITTYTSILNKRYKATVNIILTGNHDINNKI